MTPMTAAKPTARPRPRENCRSGGGGREGGREGGRGCRGREGEGVGGGRERV